MKTFLRNTFFFLLPLLAVTACEKDEDKLYLNSIEPGQLVASSDAVVLTQERSDEIVLSLAWSTDNLAVSDPALSAPDGLMSMSLEASTDENFSSVVETSETSYSKAYTGATLNALARNVGAEVGAATSVYFRLGARSGANMQPVYTNTVAVVVTPYEIDMSRLYVLDSSQAETGMNLLRGREQMESLVPGTFRLLLRRGRCERGILDRPVASGPNVGGRHRWHARIRPPEQPLDACLPGRRGRHGPYPPLG